MKIALYQSPTTDGDIERAFARIERALAAAAQAGANLAVLPELYLPGYNRPDLHAGLAQEQGGAWEKRLAGLCRDAGCGLAIGWAERDGDAIYNSASCFDATGRKVAHYRKIQLFGPMENRVFQPGNAYAVFDYDGIKAALLICYDVEFAHHVSALAAQGVKLLLVPTANPAGFDVVNHTLVPARAYENAITVVYANFQGAEAGLVFGGCSIIAGPDGKPIARAGTGETLLVADLAPLDMLDPAFLSTQARDRRDI
ncbi:(R)-stereoselective amidase [Marinibacterium anthonyi]|nr:(R)-stereoselective amidase [Marinibacterium anthonyi]